MLLSQLKENAQYSLADKADGLLIGEPIFISLAKALGKGKGKRVAVFKFADGEQVAYTQSALDCCIVDLLFETTA